MSAKGTLLTKAKARAAGRARYQAACDASQRSAAVAIAEARRSSQFRRSGIYVSFRAKRGTPSIVPARGIPRCARNDTPVHRRWRHAVEAFGERRIPNTE